jgi:hypothetical protein
MTALVKSYDLVEVAKKLNALAALDGAPQVLELTPAEVTAVIEMRREELRAWLAKRDINVLRVKAEPEAVIDDPAITPPAEVVTDELSLRKRA